MKRNSILRRIIGQVKEMVARRRGKNREQYGEGDIVLVEKLSRLSWKRLLIRMEENEAPRKVLDAKLGKLGS